MGRRLTSQRKEILDYLKSVKTHPSAETVYVNVKKKIPKITLATVYRNLHILVEQSLVKKLEVKGGFRFDGFVHDHYHLVCRKCRNLIDIENENIKKCLKNEIKKLSFQVDEFEIKLTGLCKACSKKI